jgi:hypothetical protein
MNIPVLSKVNIEHLLLIDILESLFFVGILNVLIEWDNGRDIHQGGSIDGIIFTVLDVGAWLTSSHLTLVLKIVSHETSVMDNLGKSTGIQYVIIMLKITFCYTFSDISTKAVCKHHAQYWSPSFATGIKKIVCWLKESL